MSILSHFIAFCHILSHSVTFCHLLSHSVTFCHILSHFVTFCHILSHSVTFCHILSHFVTFCHMSLNCQIVTNAFKINVGCFARNVAKLEKFLKHFIHNEAIDSLEFEMRRNGIRFTKRLTL